MITMDRGSSSIRMIVSEVWNGTSASPGMSGTTGRDPTATTNASAPIRSPSTSISLGATNRAAEVYTSIPCPRR
jgi:hypothetical protein